MTMLRYEPGLAVRPSRIAVSSSTKAPTVAVSEPAVMGAGPYRLVAAPGPGVAPRAPWLSWSAVLSGKQARRTRVAAGLAIVLLGVVVVLSIASVNDDLRRLSVQIPLLLLAVAAAWYALTRTGARRVAGAAVVAVALIGVIGYGFVQDPSTFAVALGRLALLALAVLLGRWAVRRTWAAAEPPDPPTAPVDGAAAHGPGADGRSHGRPALIINLRSGGGKAEQVHLVEECQSRGIVPIVLERATI